LDGSVEEITLGSTWRDRLDALPGGRRETLAIGAVVFVVVVCGVLLAARGAPAQIAPPALSETVTDDAGDHVRVGEVYVHVAGAVRQPGLYPLPEGARVSDAIALAGGPGRRADLDLINLAQVVLDGTKIDVPRRGEVATSVGSSMTTSEATGALVSLNQADQAALESVPGLGPVKAGAIVRHREQAGPFTSLEQVMEVSGIGPATFESIRPFVSL
jgi:competence protein ComEA